MKIGVMLSEAKELAGTRREAWKELSLAPAKGAWPHWHLDLGRLASRTGRQEVSVKPLSLW